MLGVVNVGAYVSSELRGVTNEQQVAQALLGVLYSYQAIVITASVGTRSWARMLRC